MKSQSRFDKRSEKDKPASRSRIAAAPHLESPAVRSYRDLLGVSPQASVDDIKKAYRQLASRFHPDKDSGDREKFLQISEAYEALIDPARIEKLNQSFIDTKLFEMILDGLNIRFGSFFGYRQFLIPRVDRARRLGEELPGERDFNYEIYSLSKSDSNQSILDSPAFDSIELVYAGKFSSGDEKQVMKGFKGRDMAQLPWIMANNRGISLFLEGRFEECLKTYADLNKRIPNNIIFIYRLALSHLVLAFKKPRRTLFGKTKPDKSHIENGIKLLKKAIHIGETRTVGKQRCLAIRKTLADVYEKIGMATKARQVWQEIRRIDPKSAEAKYKLTGILPKLLGRRRD